MISQPAAQVLVAGLLAVACGVEAQDAPEPLNVSPSPPQSEPATENPHGSSASKRLILPKTRTRGVGTDCQTVVRLAVVTSLPRRCIVSRDETTTSAEELTMKRDTTINNTDLHVKVTWQEDRAIVAVTGEVDIATTPRLRTALDGCGKRVRRPSWALGAKIVEAKEKAPTRPHPAAPTPHHSGLDAITACTPR
jgi:hypothetical protein